MYGTLGRKHLHRGTCLPQVLFYACPNSYYMLAQVLFRVSLLLRLFSQRFHLFYAELLAERQQIVVKSQ